VADFDAELRNLVADLFDTMCAAPGLGLAAPQIGVGLRVFVYRTEDDGYGHLVNPRKGIDLLADGGVLAVEHLGGVQGRAGVVDGEQGAQLVERDLQQWRRA
jgi:hypothetical protein